MTRSFHSSKSRARAIALTQDTRQTQTTHRLILSLMLLTVLDVVLLLAGGAALG